MYTIYSFNNIYIYNMYIYIMYIYIYIYVCVYACKRFLDVLCCIEKVLHTLSNYHLKYCSCIC